MNKYSIKLLAVTICLILALGCSQKPQLKIQDKKEAKNAVKVAMISANTANDDFIIFKNKIEKESSDAGLKFIWMDGEGSILNQEDQLEKAEKEKVKVVVIQPIDNEILNTTIKKMQNKGIKIICLNVLPADIGVDAYISPDFARAGEMQAQQLLKLIDKSVKANILILRGRKTNPVSEAIFTGNLNILQANYKIGEVWIEELPEKDAASAFDTVKKYLSGTGAPDAILAHSPEFTEGMLKAIKEFSGNDKQSILTLGMGTQKAAIEAIKSGQHSGEIDFMPDVLAQIVLKAAKSLAESGLWEYDLKIKNGSYDVTARITPARIISKDNIKVLDERVKSLAEEQNKTGQTDAGAKESSGGTKEKRTKNETGKEQNGKKTVITIKTKDGQEFKMDIIGEIESVEMKAEDKQGSEEKKNSEEQ